MALILDTTFDERAVDDRNWLDVNLCDCCAMKVANDDTTSCRDFYDHDHEDFNLPGITALSDGSFEHSGLSPMSCSGHPDGQIQPGERYWRAEHLPSQMEIQS